MKKKLFLFMCIIPAMSYGQRFVPILDGADSLVLTRAVIEVEHAIATDSLKHLFNNNAFCKKLVYEYTYSDNGSRGPVCDLVRALQIENIRYMKNVLLNDTNIACCPEIKHYICDGSNKNLLRIVNFRLQNDSLVRNIDSFYTLEKNLTKAGRYFPERRWYLSKYDGIICFRPDGTAYKYHIYDYSLPPITQGDKLRYVISDGKIILEQIYIRGDMVDRRFDSYRLRHRKLSFVSTTRRALKGSLAYKAIRANYNLRGVK